jgi:hypothetical protein
MPPSPTKLQPSGLDKEGSEIEQDISIRKSEGLELESNQAIQLAPAVPTASQESQWVTGFKLFNIIGAITIVVLLVLLDVSIVSTV